MTAQADQERDAYISYLWLVVPLYASAFFLVQSHFISWIAAITVFAIMLSRPRYKGVRASGQAWGYFALVELLSALNIVAVALGDGIHIGYLFLLIVGLYAPSRGWLASGLPAPPT